MAHPLLSRRLLHFLTVFELGNIKHAAENLGISQPALSMSLRHLEDDLGAELFVRQARGVSPTAAGEVLYRYANSMRNSTRLAEEEIAAIGSGMITHLRLGAGVAWTTTIMPDVLIELRARFPGMPIDMIAGVGDQLAGQLLSGKIDVLLAAGSMPSLDSPDIAKDFITTLPMLAVADRHHPLSQRDCVSPEELVSAPWAGFYEDESFFNRAQHYMALRGLPAPRITLRTNSAAALTSLVRASELVLLLMPPLARSACSAGLSELRLAEPLWEMPINVYYRRMVGELRSVKAFRDLVSQSIRDFR
ncbi:LysR family transcriptional regulator [Pseudotabrizicola sediminis]|uniref:LysR family transcriptional regulator n=1 Tax=Pseudotabrizicola sediminis TaxID=2486418 RepID=A0ABY2KHW0_9RHOB|nr:LysR family transcriptional regulator [Pseudotabrizicola sediminis]TGD41438.1 LysR family transcriptional regulator [Pseudotabrizicola sediminis]